MTDINHIIRQIKIDLITGEQNDIITWFNDLWSKLIIIETVVFNQFGEGGELIYYIEDNLVKQWIFYRDDKSNRFWCNDNHYWSYCESEFHLSYSNIKDITKLLVENALDNNNSIAIPAQFLNIYTPTIEEKLNKL